LNIYNQGGIGVHGTFGVLLEYPANYDAAVDSVITPGPTVCGTTFNPQVILKNWGQVQLNTATITYQIDGGTPVNYSWFGALNYLQTEVVSITPPVTLPPGIHTFFATVSSPNGFADEIPANDSVPTFSFDNTGQPVRILMRTDNYGDETGYEIFAANDFAFAAAGGTHPNSGFPVDGTPGPWADNTTIIDDICLPQNSNGQYCYIMVIYDSFGDGMCCANGNGFWSVQTQQGDMLLKDKFDVASTISPVSSIYVGQTFCLPKGPTDVLSSECDIFSNSLYSKVYCQNIGASNYQFSFENPDAGFYRRISVPRNWVQFSEMQSPSLVPGTVYFCRVRADQGSPGYSDDRFGAGCDMAIDPASINGCTQLIDNISLPTHSCGVTKTFGGSDKVWAQPVVAATQYRFRFVGLIDPDGAGPNPPAAGARNIVKTTYICPLNWTTSTLVDGETYTVTVECYLAGSWRGFCGASCQLTIDNTPVQGGGNNLHVIGQEEGSAVTMWPNPVRDGMVNLVLSEIGSAEQAVTVDVYDGFGKLVRNYEFTSTSDLFTTVLDLGDVAAGNYTVNITVGDKTYTERLNVQ
jgi:hypothetical protein